MKYAFILLLTLMQLSCEPLPEVRVIDNNPPRFSLGGRTDTLIFSVCCKEGTVPKGQESYIWEVRNTSDPKVKMPIEVSYGVIPAGFHQMTPSEDKPPPPLESGRKYSYWAQGLYGAKVGCFEITDGKAREVACDR